MLTTQTAAAVSLATIPVLAPAIAVDASLDPSQVGTHASLVFAGAMFSSSASGVLVAKFGAFRANQLVLVVSAIALLVCLNPSILALALGSLALGLGYGPNTPSSAQVLARVTPLERRGLIFSIKQSGSPLGAGLGGLTLPSIAEAAGWQTAIAVAALFIALFSILVNPLRPRDDRLVAATAKTQSQPSVLSAVQSVLAQRSLRWLTLGGFALMMVHTGLQAFTVTYLVEHVGVELVLAGKLFAVLCVAAFIGRIVLGWLSDSMIAPWKVLTAVSAMAAFAAAALVGLAADTSMWVMAAVAAIAGFASSGWYGVFLAEVSRRAEPGREGLATGGALFFVYSSIVGGPLLFMAIRFIAQSYAASLYMLALVSAAATIAFVRSAR